MAITIDGNSADVASPDGGAEVLQTQITSGEAQARLAISRIPSNTNYVHGLIYVDSHAAENSKTFETLKLVDTSDNFVAAMEIGADASGILKYRFKYRDNSSNSNYSTAIVMSTEVWYRFEYKYDLDANDWSMRVDGGTPGACTTCSGELSTPDRTPKKMVIGYQAGTFASCNLYTDNVQWDSAAWVYFGVNVSEDISLSDSFTGDIRIELSASDNMSISESPSGDIPIDVSTSDSPSLGDAPLVDILIEVSASDGPALSDSAEAVIPIEPDVSESVSITDSADALNPTVYHYVSESVSLTDSFEGFIPTIFQIAVEPISLTEAASGITTEPEVSVSDDLSLSDSPSSEIPIESSISEGMSIAEAASALNPTVYQLVSDDLAIGDSPIAAVQDPGVSTSDDMSLSESPNLIPPVLANISEPVSITDDLSWLFDLKPMPSDTISLDDDINLFTELTDVIISEPISLDDDFTGLDDKLPMPSESMSVDCTVTVTPIEIEVTVSEPISLDESYDKLYDVMPYASESLKLNEPIDITPLTAPALEVGLTGPLAETVSLDDSPANSIFSECSTSDDLSLSESPSASLVLQCVISESVSLGDDPNIITEGAWTTGNIYVEGVSGFTGRRIHDFITGRYRV